MTSSALTLGFATLAADMDTGTFWMFAALFLAVVLGAQGVILRLSTRRRDAAEAEIVRLRMALAEPRSTGMLPQDLMRQREIADAQLAKLRIEGEILKLQAEQHKQLGGERVDIQREAHELMVEKTRLEIEGLRLHIAEARKRLDDWHAE